MGFNLLSHLQKVTPLIRYFLHIDFTRHENYFHLLHDNYVNLKENDASLKENDINLKENDASLKENDVSLHGNSFH